MKVKEQLLTLRAYVPGKNIEAVKGNMDYQKL